MFETLILQNLKKLTECEIGDFPSPKAFHACQVQRFKSKCIKASTQVSREFPMPILTLPSDFPIESCEFSDSTPPVIRVSFDFTRKTFIELAELFQGLFQKLRRLYLLACAKRQKSVLHTKLCQWHNLSLLYIVCPHTFTRSGQRFGRSVVSNNVRFPVCANSVAKDLNVSDITIPFAVLVKRETSSFKLQTLRFCVPFLEGEGNSACFKFVTRLKLRRPITPFAFEFRKADRRGFECTLIGSINADNHSVKGVTRYPRPMFLCAFEEFGQMGLQAVSPRILVP